MPFDSRRMRFYKGVVLTQAQWDKIQAKTPKRKVNIGAMMAVVAGLSMGAAMQPPRPRQPPRSLDDLA
jgi:hypothetical protein